ncbi:MAG: hypothetical protein ACFE7R_06625 [Candidatus Hodarchaeota archaeon]
MSESPIKILKLSSVTLTRDKQDKIDEEFRKYERVTNQIIKAILEKGIPTEKKAIELLEETFHEKFDRRAQYFRDVVKTARVEITRHTRLSKTVRSMRDKTPKCKPNRIILSSPLVKVKETAVILELSDREKLPIPFDKRSRNRVIEELRAFESGQKKYTRVRLTMNRAGYIDIDIRVEG